MVCFENREDFLSSVSETRYCIIGLLSCYASDRVNEWPANDCIAPHRVKKPLLHVP
jgi:hypothetical protein